MLKKIEEVSKLSGVSKRTLQYYDDEGILPAKRSEENYRLYDEMAMEILWEILWYKEMGFKLREIKIILAASETEKKTLLEQKVRSIDERIQGLEGERKIIRHIAQDGIICVPAKKEEDNLTYKERIKKMKEEDCKMMWNDVR